MLLIITNILQIRSLSDEDGLSKQNQDTNCFHFKETFRRFQNGLVISMDQNLHVKSSHLISTCQNKLNGAGTWTRNSSEPDQYRVNGINIVDVVVCNDLYNWLAIATSACSVHIFNKKCNSGTFKEISAFFGMLIMILKFHVFLKVRYKKTSKMFWSVAAPLPTVMMVS